MPGQPRSHRTSPNQIELPCAHCGGTIYIMPGRCRPDKRHFCNRACQGAARLGMPHTQVASGADSGSWKGGLQGAIDRAKLHTTGAGCWIWQGAPVTNGYGKFGYRDRDTGKRRNVIAHRAVYELLVGPIPPGYELDHVYARGCRSKLCVNPDHLEPVTHAENLRRRDQVRRATQG